MGTQTKTLFMVRVAQHSLALATPTTIPALRLMVA